MHMALRFYYAESLVGNFISENVYLLNMARRHFYLIKMSS